jgi:hypothetical protein
MAAVNLTNATNKFKIKYMQASENVYNSNNVMSGRMKKRHDFTGKQKLTDVPTGFGGGVGSGTLPTPNVDPSVNVIITAKKLYGTCRIDRETIKAADGADGSFVKQTKHTVGKTVESWNRNFNRIIWNSLANGALGAGDGSTAVTGAGTTADPYLVIMSATGWKEANWEEKDYVNCGTETTLLEVYEVVPSTRQIKFVGTSAALAAAVAGTTFTSATFYMQGSRANDPTSFWAAVEATSGTLFGATVQRRWQSPCQKDSAGAGITVDVINTDLLTIHKASGKMPKMIVASYTQYGKLLNLLEDKKEYKIEPRAENLKGHFGFDAIAFHSLGGLMPIIMDRFVEDDRIAYVNDDFIEVHHRPDFGWFDDDGSVFLRAQDDDAYDARYGGYLEILTNPCFQGYRKGLAA